jgi:DNA-binding Lrp family transcriptional regulator
MADQSAARSGAERRWYSLNEAAERLGVSRQSLHQRVRKLKGAEKVDGRWQIPEQTVEALVAAERAKAVASGAVVALPGAQPGGQPGSEEVAELAERVSELEGLVRDQARAFHAALGDRDALISELRADRRRLRRALGAFMNGLAHLVDEDDDDPGG